MKIKFILKEWKFYLEILKAIKSRGIFTLFRESRRLYKFRKSGRYIDGVYIYNKKRILVNLQAINRYNKDYINRIINTLSHETLHYSIQKIIYKNVNDEKIVLKLNGV